MKWFIPYNVPSSKNSKRIVKNNYTNKPMIISSKLTQDYKRKTKSHYFYMGIDFRGYTKGMNLPLEISFRFIRDSKRKFDYINAAQIVQDLMVEYNWIQDDNCDILIPNFLPYIVDKNNPGVEISLKT